MDGWVEHELEAGEFPDQRLRTRLGKILGDLGQKIGETLPTACQDWAATKAAYRFFSSPRVDESLILAGHFAATKARFAGTSGPVLVLHDTTVFSFKRDKPEAIGQLSLLKGRHASHTVCGLLMHSSLVLTTQGLPLGLAAIKFWTRKKFKGTNELKKRVNLTRIPIEQKESVRWLENKNQSTELLGDPSRCVHVGDRESDIYELFCAAEEAGTHFLVRTCVDRLAGSGGTTTSRKMGREPIRGDHQVDVRDDHGRVSMAKVNLRFCRMTVHPPIGKHQRYPALSLTVIHAHERGKPRGREPIRWNLLTNLPVKDLSSAIEKLGWYAQRWKIETFHKILKSGCQAEQSKLRTAERLTNVLAVLCIIGWRVFWLTMMNRTAPEAPAEVALTRTEIEILDHLGVGTKPPAERTVARYLVAIAKLGGYLAREKDPPPGNMVLWRGLTRLADIHIGFDINRRLVGNWKPAIDPATGPRPPGIQRPQVRLGRPRSQVRVIDDDLGKSRQSIEGRPGFQRLLAEIALDRVGMILGLEMSRLARSCKDWHHLLELCARFRVLLADADGVYDSTEYSDRLLLGLTGMMNEAELHVLKQRMHQGKLIKASAGNWSSASPPGMSSRRPGRSRSTPTSRPRASSA